MTVRSNVVPTFTEAENMARKQALIPVLLALYWFLGLVFNLEDGGSKFLRNVTELL
jgi:hypothetical protein